MTTGGPRPRPPMTFDRRRWTPVLVVVVAVVVWFLQQKGILATDPGAGAPGPGPAASSPESRPAPAGRAAPAGRPATAGGYAPASAAPADALPGGSLSAHEGLDGGHTLDRHVGRTLDDLKRRAAAEGKREVSTFPDLASADRAVAAVLHRKATAVAAWLRDGPDGLRDVSSTLDAPVGTVWRADRGGSQPGRTVVVVLAPSRRFPAGFRIHTAYVTLP